LEFTSIAQISNILSLQNLSRSIVVNWIFCLATIHMPPFETPSLQKVAAIL